MMKPYSITLTCRCCVKSCGRIDNSVQTLHQGEQFCEPNHIPSGWVKIGALLVCDKHKLEVKVDDNLDWYERPR